MKQKDYSMMIRKHIAVLLHIIFLTLVVAGITLMYTNTQSGKGIHWLTDRHYENSSRFEEQFQEDLDNIFAYVAYRDVFETDGFLDLSKEMFSVVRGDGPEIIYTLDEVLRYAKSQGFYLDDDFEVVNDLFLYDNASTTRDQRVIWRAYDPNATISEPGDAYSSLLDLSKEVLNCLSKYYKVYYRMINSPSNFYFRIAYDEMDDGLLYTNAADMELEDFKSLGRYCLLTSDSIFVDTNLKQIPPNLTISMEKNNLYDSSEYYMIAGVDTSYSAEDAYAVASQNYNHQRNRFLEGILALTIGLIGCLISLYYLILVSGYQTLERVNPYLHGFDMVTTESCIMLTFLCTLFALFLGEKIGYRLLHLLLQEPLWPYGEQMIRAVIIYACCMGGAFSLLRRYKSRTLWSNSLMHHIYLDINQYFTNHTFTRRLFCLYMAFLGTQMVGIGLIVGLIQIKKPFIYFLIFLLGAGLLAIDYTVFRKLFLATAQEDQIANAIAKIAGGDTSYQMDLSQLTGKELAIGQMINNIGIGLERALQEKFKSERLKADLITNVSHDIKTPLTSIINYVDLLKREKLPGEKVQEYLNVLDQKSQRLKTLTEDLVEASKASSGNLKLEMAKLDLVEMIWQTGGEFEEKFASRNLELVSNLPNESIIIEADGRRLWRVLENLYNNAFKYAMEHSRVYTEITKEDNTVWFTIKNVSQHPLNIDGNDLTERFVRGDVSRSTEGSGLGLSIAQSLTKLQGGTFEILIDGDLFKAKVGFPIFQKDPSSNTVS